MARIAGVNIPQNKVVHVALTYIHGVGKKFSNNICTKLNIAKPSTKIIPVPGKCMTLKTDPIRIINTEINPVIFNVRFIA